MRMSVYERLERDRAAARHAQLAAERKEREIASARYACASIGLDLALVRLQRALTRKYRADQPRVPAGSPEGGQWTSGDSTIDVDVTGSTGNDGAHDPTLTPQVIEAAQSGRRLTPAECWEQYERDVFHCKMVGLKSCYAQASERFSACLSGRPIPPLNY